MILEVLEENKAMPTLGRPTSHDTTPAEPLPQRDGEVEVSQIAIAFIIGSVAVATILLATAVFLYLRPS
ncbi:MAG: hypothetical protein EXS29_07800 [Pedosphaera sp.]|nr:hypothetical protein [Pedosphaera sp.]MST01198.1 hypothetical protein [Pedosphaera sp.]